MTDTTQAKIERAIDCGIKRRSTDWTELPSVEEVPEDWDEMLMEWNDNPASAEPENRLWFARTLDRISVIELMDGNLRGSDNTRLEATEALMDIIDLTPTPTPTKEDN